MLLNIYLLNIPNVQTLSRYEILRYIRKYWSPSSSTYSKTANLKLKQNKGKNVKVHKPTGLQSTGAKKEFQLLEAEIQNLRRQRNHSEQGHEEEHESEPEIEQPVPPRAPEHPVIQQEPLYERFRRMKPDEFEGSSDPLVAEEWLSSIQTILDFMHLNEREKVLCATYVLKRDARYWWETVKMRRNVQDMTWDEFIVEFNQKYYNRMAMRAQQNEMLEMFRPELVVVIDSGDNPPTTVAECVDRALRAKYRLAQAKEERNRIFEARKNQKGQTKQGYEMKPNSQA
ncbi:hypothetical protein UlMin_046279 [Ulmus minor]